LHLVRDEGRQKRGGNIQPQGNQPPDQDVGLLDQLVGTEPTPEIALQLAEEAERLLGTLPSSDLVELALLKMEGYTNEEIAQRWQKAERTVERKLRLIRQFWERHQST
jgi:DNA-directed RNA polymerase specialized sigma24 family protein